MTKNEELEAELRRRIAEAHEGQTTLDLSGMKLIDLPSEIGTLSGLRELRLTDTPLESLPPWIERLTSLKMLDLSGTKLVKLPSEIGHLTRLRHLDLSRTRLDELPTQLWQLRRLERLELSDTRLELLAPEVGQLARLQALNLSGTRLIELTSEISRLSSLVVLRLDRTYLSELTRSIGHLTNLQTLTLDRTLLAELPEEIGNLHRLRHLTIAETPITRLPAGFWRLTQLVNLDFSGTNLTSLPHEIGELTKLEGLALSRTPVSALPPEIGQLADLQMLNVAGCRLTTLPPEIARLSGNVELHLEGNPFIDPLPSIIAQGIPALFTYLPTLRNGKPQYEAKVLLVGEGNVGKTSLVAALCGNPFIEGRSTTHGIELDTLRVRHPALDVNIELNTWDFGGQEVYRITHQFFFSPRSLYLLVWRPREGREENAIEDWIKLIRLRVGDAARILVVATHGDERNPELDYPGLVREFGSVLAAHQYRVDNKSGRGIAELRRAIGVEASKLPQMGELLSTHWTEVRANILARTEPHISRDEFEVTCERHGLDSKEAATLVTLLHDLGHIIHYEADEGLRNIIVLQPEWLTKAIGYVLEDTQTREAGGVLRHGRLREIWQDRRDGASYPASYHPYFLRLMEKFDVSYRLEEEPSSLVGQLVPYERPSIPWDELAEFPPDIRTLRLICSMSESPPGLLPWLIVRTNRFSTNLHWRRGVFLEDKSYAQQALIELVADRRLQVTVGASSPDGFFHILRDSLEFLISQRWEGLEYELLVPCLGALNDGRSCPGEFPFNSLLGFREQGKTSIDCYRCYREQDVSTLLTGFTLPKTPLDQVLGEVKDTREEVRGLTQRAAEIASQVRTALKLISTEIDDCPRLFTIEPKRASAWRPARVFQVEYRLTLWCEQPGQQHPWEPATYVVQATKKWLSDLMPYAQVVCELLRLAVPLAGAAAGVVLPEHSLRRVEHQIELVKAVAERLPSRLEVQQLPLDVEGTQGMSRAQNAGLRALRMLLFEIDKPRTFGRLRRFVTIAGDIIWVCPEHHYEYDPGLPILPS